MHPNFFTPMSITATPSSFVKVGFEALFGIEIEHLCFPAAG